MKNKTVISLDVGNARIGVAMASLSTRLPSPYGVVVNNQKAIESICELASKNQAIALIVGLPRNLDGQDTAQTKQIRTFASKLAQTCKLPIHLQDEALTSRQAEQELKQRGVSYNREAVDALAATYILTDYLQENPELAHEEK